MLSRNSSRSELSEDPIDIVLLDMNLTDSHGIDVAKRMNAKGYGADIIAITAVRHLQVIRSAISSGVTQYLIKPFTFAIFREKLENQRDFRLNLTVQGRVIGDAGHRRQCAQRPAVGLVGTVAQGADRGDSHSDLWCRAGRWLCWCRRPRSQRHWRLSRVTVWRYLEHLVKTKQTVKQPRHGTPGRPEYEYRWV